MDAGIRSRFDVLHLAITHGGNEIAIRRMLELSIAGAEECIDRLEKATSTQNPIAWLQACQELRMAADAITARRLAGLCNEAELIRQLPHDHALHVLYHLQKELVLLKNEIAAT